MLGMELPTESRVLVQPVSERTTSGRRRTQGRYWMLTIPEGSFNSESELHRDIAYIKGQKETGETTGYVHWQLMAIAKRKISLRTIKLIFGQQAHAELTRSEHAEAYVWKESTRVLGTQFERGVKPFQRNNGEDWDRVWQLAVENNIMDIGASIRVQHYRTLRAITADYAQPIALERQAVVYWGDTGVGKSLRAWTEAGMGAYPKDPRSKFWCAYQGQQHVIIDEFRGDIDISHLLRWLDRYPVVVEIKGAAQVLTATKFWITSNLHPRDWYPTLDSATFAALERRLTIVHMEGRIDEAFFLPTPSQ